MGPAIAREGKNDDLVDRPRLKAIGVAERRLIGAGLACAATTTLLGALGLLDG